jgi:hypothetical protein
MRGVTLVDNPDPFVLVLSSPDVAANQSPSNFGHHAIARTGIAARARQEPARASGSSEAKTLDESEASPRIARVMARHREFRFSDAG